MIIDYHGTYFICNNGTFVRIIEKFIKPGKGSIRGTDDLKINKINGCAIIEDMVIPDHQ